MSLGRSGVVTLLTAFAVVACGTTSSTPAPRLDVNRIVARAVPSWTRESGIPVTDMAEFLIRDAFQDDEQHLINALYPPGLELAAEDARERRIRGRFLLTAFVHHYLYDLRDIALSDSLSEATAGHIVFAASLRVPLTITAPAVERFRPSNFIGRLLTLLMGPAGRLYVTSAPAGASITIDASTADYFTDRSFLVSAGHHTLIVAMMPALTKCSRAVDVIPYRSTRFSCRLTAAAIQKGDPSGLLYSFILGVPAPPGAIRPGTS